MARCVRPVVLVLFAASSLAGCGFFSRPERPIWRTQAENACFARKLVTPSEVHPDRPRRSTAGRLRHDPPAESLGAGELGRARQDAHDRLPDDPGDRSLAELDVVQPDAMAHFGQRVATVNVVVDLAARSTTWPAGCRSTPSATRSTSPASPSPMVGTLEFVRDWKRADTQEAAFLHEAHAGACQYFTTVLGPGADVFHYNHIHLDLANHGATDTGPRRICKPTPSPNLTPAPAAPDGLPPAPEMEEPLDTAHSGDKRAVALAAGVADRVGEAERRAAAGGDRRGQPLAADSPGRGGRASIPSLRRRSASTMNRLAGGQDQTPAHARLTAVHTNSSRSPTERRRVKLIPKRAMRRRRVARRASPRVSAFRDFVRKIERVAPHGSALYLRRKSRACASDGNWAWLSPGRGTKRTTPMGFIPHFLFLTYPPIPTFGAGTRGACRKRFAR